MNDLRLPDLYEAAARASINERCAQAYLHDVRGSMQALFSAVELLSRSARAGSGNTDRVEMACELARRAIRRHEKAIIDAMQLLTLQRTSAAAVDLRALVADVVRFLRADAASKAVEVTLNATALMEVRVDRAALQTALLGLVSDAIAAAPAGATLPLTLVHTDEHAVLTMATRAGYDLPADPLTVARDGGLPRRLLTWLFAGQVVEANGGSLNIDKDTVAGDTMELRYPLAKVA